MERLFNLRSLSESIAKEFGIDVTAYDFIIEILRKVPGLEEIFREHEDFYDELIPHVLMGDIARFAQNLAGASRLESDQASATLTQLMMALERGMNSKSSPVQELIAVSFLESLDEDDSSFAAVAKRFGPSLSHEMTRLHGGDDWNSNLAPRK